MNPKNLAPGKIRITLELGCAGGLVRWYEIEADAVELSTRDGTMHLGKQICRGLADLNHHVRFVSQHKPGHA